MSRWRFEMDGHPVVQKRARRSRNGHFYDPSALSKRVLAGQMLHQKTLLGMPLLDGSVGLEIVFYGARRGDIDNMLKAVMDAGNGILWEDDQQIIAVIMNVVRKSDSPRTSFAIYKI